MLLGASKLFFAMLNLTLALALALAVAFRAIMLGMTLKLSRAFEFLYRNYLIYFSRIKKSALDFS